MIKAPTFFIPSYTIFIDDDILYPQIITTDIPNCPTIISCSDFNFIIKQKDNDFLFLDENNCINTQNITTILNDNIKNKNLSITNMISVLIVDLNMENLNGLDLLNQIKSPFIYKVLISNYISGNNKEMVKFAQNNGTVDEVIEKGIHLIDNLPKIIYRGQIKFFTALSNQIFPNKEKHNYLTDTNIATKFIEIINHLKPEIIWPEPDLTSFIFLKKGCLTYRVFFTTQNEINALIDSYNCNQIPKQALKRLQNNEHIICHKNPQTLEADEWPYFIRPAHKINSTSGETILYQITSEDISNNRDQIQLHNTTMVPANLTNYR